MDASCKEAGLMNFLGNKYNEVKIDFLKINIKKVIASKNKKMKSRINQFFKILVLVK